MIWKILHSLFGWDYIWWENSCDQGVARVYMCGDGAPYYWQYKSLPLAKRITSADAVIWLTCPPEKWMPPQG